jgi:hypothetical protein
LEKALEMNRPLATAYLLKEELGLIRRVCVSTRVGHRV